MHGAHILLGRPFLYDLDVTKHVKVDLLKLQSFNKQVRLY